MTATTQHALETSPPLGKARSRSSCDQCATASKGKVLSSSVASSNAALMHGRKSAGVDETSDVPTWYRRLNDYFPACELKAKEHIAALLKENDMYTLEGDDGVLTFAVRNGNGQGAVQQPYLFIDYLLVSAERRGQGLGGKEIARWKEE